MSGQTWELTRRVLAWLSDFLDGIKVFVTKTDITMVKPKQLIE